MNNQILEAVPSKERTRLIQNMTLVALPRGSVLFDAGDTIDHIYFPLDVMISYLASTTDGRTIEVGLVGNEGVAGIAALFGESTAFRAIVQISGSAFRISRSTLKREFENNDVLRDLLLRYANALLIQVAQTAVCNKFHSVEARFCRWLLMAYDRSGAGAMEITHDILARTLGTRRATVTIIAGRLERAGAIRHSRGRIAIENRKALESRVCECYEIISAAYAASLK